MKTFRDLLGFGFMPRIVFDSGGDSGGGGGGGSDDSGSSTPAPSTAVPTFNTYYDAIDAGYGGQDITLIPPQSQHLDNYPT